MIQFTSLYQLEARNVFSVDIAWRIWN